MSKAGTAGEARTPGAGAASSNEQAPDIDPTSSTDSALIIDREKGLTIARTCTYFNVRKATRVLGELFDEALRPHGIKGTQFSLLVAVSAMGEPTISGLAQALGADRTTLTRTVAPLERDGLLESVPGSDRRERLVRLTTPGRNLLSAAYTDWQRTQKSILEAMGMDSWEQLMTGLRRVHELTVRPDAPTSRTR